LSEQRKYRSWTAKQKLEIVLAGLKGDRSVRDVCREHGISEAFYYGWRDKLFEAGLASLAGKEEHQVERELKKRVGQLERARSQDLRVGDRGGSIRGTRLCRHPKPVAVPRVP
jgi:transposase-like protein